MSLVRPALAVVLLGCAALTAKAQSIPDPLRLLPEHSDLVAKIEQPGRIVDRFLNHELSRQLRSFEAVREAYDSTNLRRFYQLLEYVEKELGMSRLELIDQLAGGGIAVGTKVGQNAKPAVFIIQGKNEALWHRAWKLFLNVLEQELARQESREKPVKGSYKKLETVRIGKDFHAAVAGSALVISNAEVGINGAIDSLLDGKKGMAGSQAIVEARKLVGPDALAWLCFDLDVAKKSPGGKEIFTMPRNDAQLTVLFGGYLDVAGRAPFLAGGLYEKAGNFSLSFRMPRGRDGMLEGMSFHVPLKGEPGSRPLLEPKGVLFASSFYLDLVKIWDHRKELLNEKQIKTFEEGDKSSNKFIAGLQFSKIASMTGPYYRVVTAHQPSVDYKVKPEQTIPAFGIVVEARDAEGFYKRAENLIRSGVVLATTQVKLKSFEEQRGKYKIIGYRFPEDGTFPGDTTNFRFNFSPCFAMVGNQFLVCSTVDLARNMVDLIEKEEPTRVANSRPSTGRAQFYSSGGSELLEFFKDQLLAQIILDRAMPADQANEEVKAAIDFVRKLGVFQIDVNYAPNSFQYDLRLQLHPK